MIAFAARVRQTSPALRKRIKVHRYIQQSTTFIYGDHGSEIVDETLPIPSVSVPHRQSTVDMEGSVKASPLDWVILRGGAFYGAGTGAEDGWRTSARELRPECPEMDRLSFPCAT